MAVEQAGCCRTRSSMFLKAKDIDDAMAALSVTLISEEIARLEAPCTPRRDAQGISDPVFLVRATETANGIRRKCRLTSSLLRLRWAYPAQPRPAVVRTL